MLDRVDILWFDLPSIFKMSSNDTADDFKGLSIIAELLSHFQK